MKETTCEDFGYDLIFPVRYGEIGEHGVATLSSLGNWLQEAAGLSADSLGFGESVLLPLGKTWILTRLVLRIHRLPHAGETLRVHTWPSTLDRFGHRGYEVFDENGKLIVSGGSAWSVLNIADRSLSPIPEELTRIYPSNPRPCDPFACRVIPRAKSEDHATLLRVRRDDLDINGHVNNTRYLAWLMEPLPLRSSGFSLEGDVMMPRLLDVTFRAECFPQEELRSVCSASPVPAGAPSEILGREASFGMLHSIVRPEDKSEVCRALSLWEKLPQE